MCIGRKFKNMLVVMLSVMLMLSSFPTSVFAEAVPEAKPPAAFTDVQAGDWFSEAVEYVSRLNLMNGTSEADGSFSPGSSLTRAMLVTVLHRHAGSPVVEPPAQPFADVRESDWFAAAVNWANKAGIAKGTGGNRFSPNLPVTREQAAVFIHRYVLEVDVPWMEPSDEDGSISVEGAISEDMSFADEAGISEWASASVAWSRRHGLFVGKPGNLFVPNAQITRGEIAVLMYRFAEKVVAFADELVPAQPPDTDNGTSDGDNADTGSSTILVSYQTNGGAVIQPTRLRRGNRLAEVPVPQREGYLFEGWFRNPTLTEAFYLDVPFYSSTTLYAAYREREYEYREFVDPTLFLGECAADASFEIETDLTLNTSNLSQFVMLEDLNTQTDSALPGVTALSGSRYTLSPNVPYEPGRTYELTLLDNDIIFTGRDPQVRTLAFTIAQPEKYEVSFEDTIAYLTWDQVTVQEEDGTYLIENSVVAAKGIAVGKTICLTDEVDNGVGVLNGDAKIRNVIAIVDIPGSSPARVQLLTESAETEDLYESLDIHVQAGLDVDALSGQIQLAKLEEDLRTSENTRRFTQLLAVAISGSETVRAMNATVDAPVWLSPLEYERTVNAMLSGLNISTSLEITTNDSFADVADNKWLKLTVAFHYNTKINQLDLDAEFSFVEYFTLNTGSTATKGVMKLDAFDVHIDAYSQTEMAFMILVKTASNDGFVDITKEVSKLIEGLTKDNTAVPTFLEEVLGNRGDYITVAEVDLYSYTYRVQNPIPVLEINFDIKFVVKLNMALGLDARTTLMSARRIGVQGSETEGTIRKYDYALNGDNRQSFELVCAGYLGLKAGILLDLNVCFTGLEKLGKVGVSGEVGVYMDLWGYLKLDLYKDNLTPKPTISMNGGMLMELGLYVELKLYAVSEVFGAKAELVLLDRKFPMYTLGNQYVVYRFDQGGKTVIMNTNEMDLKHLLGIQILDLKTGKITGGEYTQLKDFSLEVSNPWFYYHEAYGQRLAVGPEFFGTTKNGVYVPKGTQKLETTLRVHYDGGSLSFSLGNFNEVKVIWVDPSVDPNTVDLGGIRKATYQLVLDGVTTKVETKLVPAGEVPGAVDLSPWLQYTDIKSHHNDCHAAIWTDTTYTYVLEPLQIFASYIYWANGTWRYERYALEMGDVLPEPPGAQSSTGMVFRGWDPDVYWTPFDSDDLGSMVITPEIVGFYKDIGLTHTGYDTTVPVEIFTGAQTPCVTRYLQNNTDPDTKSVFHSMAMYDPVRVNITYMYPVATHYVYGEAVTVFASQETREVWYGNKPAASMPAYPYWRPTGWDADGDHIVDYAYDNLPIATHDATYRLMLMRQDVSHTVTYRTAHGQFSDGSQVMTFIGDYPACQAYMDDFSETLGPVVENGIRYTFTGWQQFAGYASFEFDAQWQAEALVYTATFDAGEGVFTVAGSSQQTIAVRYGDGDAVDFSAFIQPEKAADVVHTYSLTGWRDGEGTVYGLADQPVLTADTTFTAVYAQTDIVYTVEVNAGNGTFGDGTIVKRYHGKYGDPLSISVDAPVPPEGVANYYVYEFDGWSAAFPTSFTQDMIIAATYRQVDIPYAIVFDAGGGYFDGDPAKTQISGTYTYGQAVAIPTSPARANEETGGSTFGYAFIGWSPTVQAVSGDQTYIATYSRYLVGGEVGITVSDGSITEDISVGSLGEYSYFVHDTLGVPTLRVTTGSVITISGSSDDLRLEIDSGVEAVRFKDLAISVDGASAPVYGKSETLFIEPYSGSDPAAETLQVVVEGTCVVDNVRMDGVSVYLERPVRFGGAGEDPSLTITGSAYTLIYRTDELTFQDLSLALNAQRGSSGVDASWVFGDIDEFGDAKLFRLDGVQGDFDSTADGFMGANLQIVDSTIAMDCAGSLGTVSALTIQNSTLTATGGTGFSVTDTTVHQSVQFTDPADITITVVSGPAINPVTELQVQTSSALEVDGGMLRYLVP